MRWFTFVRLVWGVEKYLKKLIGNTDIEDTLESLDKLTQEEARMASAEQLRIAHSVEESVMGVNRKLKGYNPFVISYRSCFHSERSGLFTGNMLRDNLLRWLSPSDPSINHNIASKAHHDGTAQWFFQGRIFNQWKSVGSFLWVHGKRVFLFIFTLRHQS